MCKFIFSVLLVLLSFTGKGQTVDGKLYTIFNNWYQWSGGKFNTNLNIPKVTATTGRDTGGIRYNLADSSMYIWTGSQWRKVGDGGTIPTLQQVTTAGNSTNNPINAFGYQINNSFLRSFYGIDENAYGVLQGLYIGLDTSADIPDGKSALIRADNLSGLTKNLYLPNISGNLSVGVAVNGTTYMAGTNGISDLGTISSDTTSLSNRINERVKYTDTAAMLSPYLRSANVVTPTLQQVTTAGNSTTDSILSPVFVIDGITSNFAISEDGAGSGRIALKNTTGTYASTRLQDISFVNGSGNLSSIIKSSTAANYSNTLPDTTGILSAGVAVNGTTYMAGTNGITNIGNTDTATVVKAYVTNAEAVTITKGQVVYIFGASGDRASVKLAKNTSDTFSSKTLGIVRADIAAGDAGWITTQGQVSGINLGAYSPGDILWLDSVAGGFTATKPQAPYHSVFVGVVERANAGNGLIYVKPANGVELDELHDVRITSLANNEIIRYNSTLGYWENKSVESILQFDTVPLAVFGAGSGAAGDTAAFSTSALYGSFYNAGSDTLIITQMRAGVLGTSPSITTEVYWNDSLNITAGATILVSGGTSVTGTIGETNVTSFTDNKIPPGVWVFVRTSAVATKPTYFTLTLLGYKKRI
jgi:hypothetical protein